MGALKDFLRKRRRGLLIGSGLVAMVLAAFLTTGLYRLFLLPLDVGEPIRPEYGDLILVFGGGLQPRLTIGISTRERLDLALALFHQRPRKILLSDGSLYRRSPAIEKIRTFLRRRGVADSFLILEGRSQNTFESAVNCKKIIESNGFSQVILCTSPYHQRRSAWILEYLEYPPFRVAKMDKSEVYRDDSFKQRFRNIRLIFRDYVALAKFVLLRR